MTSRVNFAVRKQLHGLLVATIVLHGFALAGCAGNGNNNRQKIALTALSIEPGDVTLQVDGDTTPSQNYKATGTYADGHTEDVSTKVVWSTNPSTLGVFNAATFTTVKDNGGVGDVVATLDEQVATSKITITLKKTVLNTADGTLPDDPAAKFAVVDMAGGAINPSYAPQIIYPTPSVVFPPNLGAVEIHWRKVAATTLFEISFKNSLTDLRVYTRCSKKVSTFDDGCIWSLDPLAWRRIAYTNRGADALSMKIRATDDSGTAVGESASQTMEFTKDDVVGGVYYWGNKGYVDGSTSTIFRFDFGKSDGTVEVAFPYSVLKSAPGKCVGCHVVSRSGNRMAARSSGGEQGYLLYDFGISDPLKAALVNETANAGNKTALWFSSFSPDGKQLVASHDGVKALYFYKTDCSVDDPSACVEPTSSLLTGESYLMQPVWSPDGGRIASSDGTKFGNGILDSRIVYLDATAGGWSEIKEWVPRVAGLNRTAPSFAPDSSFIVFTQSACDGTFGVGTDDYKYSCYGYADDSARIYAVMKDSNVPIQLTKLNTGSAPEVRTALRNTFARFAPLTSKYKFGSDEEIFWLTFSSRRIPGLRHEPTTQNGRAAYLWMVAIRPSQLKQNMDPSFPAFVLPFQDFETSNHMAEWTEKVVTPIAF